MEHALRFTRREVLKALLAGGPAAAAAGMPTGGAAAQAAGNGTAAPAASTPSTAAAAPYVWRFFNAKEVRAVEAAIDRLIPTDALGPGAKDAGVAVFLDQQLAGAWGSGDHFYKQGPFVAGTPQQGYQLSFTPAQMFRAGLASLDQAAASGGKGAFADLDSAAQDQLLKRMQAGDIPATPLPSAVFFAALLDATIEGYFADPVYGGNRDMASWKLVGFPGAYASYMSDVERHGVAWTRPPISIADAAHGGHGGHMR
ncbi:gluconate 2-dehydrogenase subunit 3 family protein [Pigmentiphaga litoralis]|uniref:gluconate 2-dehydrogenase subunit 3 family protein n=1 Tax=Pigmentiphaga litoralis TaxID=516702 RepID=UPI003B42A1B7